MTLRSHAQALAEYFGRFTQVNPSEDEWTIGLKLAEQWLALIDSPNPAPARVEVLVREVERLEQGHGSGSGILDLSLGIHAWARSHQM